jgi:micrococcal nuclease
VYKRLLLLGALVLVALVEFWSMRLQFRPRQESAEVPQEAISAATSRDDERVMVAHVLDGDTIVLVDGRRVRFIGIDAPEVSHEGSKAECFSQESKDATQRLLAGKEVQLVKDVSDTDSYGRLLRYVYAGDVFVNELLVGNGFATVWSVAPDEQHKELLAAAQVKAKELSRGLWQLCRR